MEAPSRFRRSILASFGAALALIKNGPLPQRISLHFVATIFLMFSLASIGIALFPPVSTDGAVTIIKYDSPPNMIFAARYQQIQEATRTLALQHMMAQTPAVRQELENALDTIKISYNTLLENYKATASPQELQRIATIQSLNGAVSASQTKLIEADRKKDTAAASRIFKEEYNPAYLAATQQESALLDIQTLNNSDINFAIADSTENTVAHPVTRIEDIAIATFLIILFLAFRLILHLKQALSDIATRLEVVSSHLALEKKSNRSSC